MRMNGNYYRTVFLCFLSCSYRENFPSFNRKKNMYNRYQNLFICMRISFSTSLTNLRIEKVTVLLNVREDLFPFATIAHLLQIIL